MTDWKVHGRKVFCDEIELLLGEILQAFPYWPGASQYSLNELRNIDSMFFDWAEGREEVRGIEFLRNELQRLKSEK